MVVKVCLDTCVFIAVKNNEPDASACEAILNAIDEDRIQGVISPVVVAEVLVGYYQNQENDEADKFMSHSLLHYEVQPVNLEIAQKAAEIRGHSGLKLPDAIIVATALHAGADVLITNDIPVSKKGRYQVLSPPQFEARHLLTQV